MNPPIPNGSRRRLAALLSAAVALLLVARGYAIDVEAPTIGTLSAAQITALKSGRVLRTMTDTMPFRGQAVALIQAPVNQLAEILLDYPNATKWAPSMAEMRLVSRAGNIDVLEGVTDLPWPIPDRTWRMRAVIGPKTVAGRSAWTNEFQYVPGTGNINESAGYWVLAPLPDDPEWTYAKYVLYGDPGISLPDFVIRWASGSALPGIMNGLRNRHAQTYPGSKAALP
jgi:hypothetical protein